MPDKTSTKKIDQSPYYEEILRVFNAHKADLIQGRITQKRLFTEFIVPLLPSDTNIGYVDFSRFVRKQNKMVAEITSGKSLIDREIEKQKQQIEIRQDATELMGGFITNLKELAQDKEALAKMQPRTILNLYKIIREEEDRAKALSLKERSENRADAAFAFLMSMARANQLTEEDIEFLNNDIKQELQAFKQANGIYLLLNQPLEQSMTVDQDLTEALT